jgi:hypothetical protein
LNLVTSSNGALVLPGSTYIRRGKTPQTLGGPDDQGVYYTEFGIMSARVATLSLLRNQLVEEEVLGANFGHQVLIIFEP